MEETRLGQESAYGAVEHNGVSPATVRTALKALDGAFTVFNAFLERPWSSAT